MAMFGRLCRLRAGADRRRKPGIDGPAPAQVRDGPSGKATPKRPGTETRGSWVMKNVAGGRAMQIGRRRPAQGDGGTDSSIRKSMGYSLIPRSFRCADVSMWLHTGHSNAQEETAGLPELTQGGRSVLPSGMTAMRIKLTLVHGHCRCDSR